MGENFHNHVLTGVIREGKQQVPPGKQNLSEVALFCKSDPAVAGARPADRIRARAVRHHRRADAPERDHDPAGRRAAALARLRPAVERRSAGEAAREPELPRREGRTGTGWCRAVKLAREIFATKAFSEWAGRGAAARPTTSRSSDDDLNAFVTRQGRLLPPPGRLLPHGPRRARGRRPRAARARRRGPARRRRERDAGRAVGQLPRGDRDDRRALRRLRQDDARPAPRRRRDGPGAA